MEGEREGEVMKPLDDVLDGEIMIIVGTRRCDTKETTIYFPWNTVPAFNGINTPGIIHEQRHLRAIK